MIVTQEDARVKKETPAERRERRSHHHVRNTKQKNKEGRGKEGSASPVIALFFQREDSSLSMYMCLCIDV